MTQGLKKFLEWLREGWQYQPPEESKQFVLPEMSESEQLALQQEKVIKARQLRERDVELGQQEADNNDRQQELSPIIMAYQHGRNGRITVSCSLEENKETLTALYHLPRNKDLQLREFTTGGSAAVKIMLAFIDGMIDKKQLSEAVIEPLMKLRLDDDSRSGAALLEELTERIMTNTQAQRLSEYADVTKQINGGDCMIFVDGAGEAITADVKSFPSRGISKTDIERTVRGSQAAFGEALRPNTALLHAMLQSTDLVTELYPIGRINAKSCAVMYVEGIVNRLARRELVRRIKGIRRDEVFDAGTFSQMLSENRLQFPENMSTERPDRVVAALMQGRIAVMVDGDPFAYIAPINLWDFFHNPEDYEMRLPAAVFMRSLRYLGTVIGLLLPGLYLALVKYHHEALPTEIMLTIAGYQQSVPFTASMEIVFMILAFELIRESTMRVPGQLGGSIGIVGAIVLGQAAVTAKIVSPLMVVIIAITGLASYVLPEYRMGFAARVTQYVILVASGFLGLVGVSIAIVFLVLELVSIKSLGVPYMAPLIPRTATRSDILRIPSAVGIDMRRPDELNTERVQKKAGDDELWRTEKPEQKKGDNE